jgi:hypothetical protein
MLRPLILAALATVGCVETLPPLDETTSLAVELVAPADPGAPDRRLDDSARTVMIRVTAKDAQNQIDTGVTRTLRVYAQFLGSLTPAHDAVAPLATIDMAAGVTGVATITLPPVFGPTTLWVEDNGPGGSFAAGASPALWFREPTTSDISTPRDLMALDALSASPLQNKQVTITDLALRRARPAGRHRDLRPGLLGVRRECADDAGNPPCVARATSTTSWCSRSRGPRTRRAATSRPASSSTASPAGCRSSTA